jgi:hypothetical protein
LLADDVHNDATIFHGDREELSGGRVEFVAAAGFVVASHLISDDDS